MRGFINGLTIAWGIAFLSLFKYKHDSTYSIPCEESGSETPYLLLLIATGVVINNLLQKSQASTYDRRKIVTRGMDASVDSSLDFSVDTRANSVNTLRLNTPD